MKLPAAPTTVLASFVRLLDFPGADAETEIKRMFSEWGVTKWVDLACFAAKDVEAFIDASESAALRPQRLRKQLGFLMEYARLGHDVDPTTSIRSVICAVDAYCANPHKSDPRPPMSPSRTSLHPEKKTVPDLKEFTGKDEDYFSWRDSAVNDLGKAGLIRFTNDPSTVTKQPEMATSVFYALRAALQNGTASNFDTALYDDNQCNPLNLWRNIEQLYDTLVNHAYVVLFEVKKLFSLCLDPDVVPTKFITDFNECLLRLKKNKAGLATDTDTLRTLLLVAIQDEQFEPVRDTIVKEPTRGVDEILKDLRDRETSLQIKDSAHAEKPIQLARHAQGTYTWNTYYSPNAAVKGWRIPKFPNSWKTAFGPKLFQMLINWRTAAHKKASQEQLNEDFPTSMVEYTARQPKWKSRCAQQPPTPTEPDSPVTEQITTTRHIDLEDSDNNYNVCVKKRICLRKSRRVLTECQV